MTHPPLVSVRCTTFNQAGMIRDCLNGILAQQTDFPWEIVVYDDASTDGTSDIVREYAARFPDLIRAVIQPENLWSRHDGSFEKATLSGLNGKYIAFCEGDDFWTDPLKLQKQVRLLEKHPKALLCHTGFQTVDLHGVPIHRPDYDRMMRRSRSGDIFPQLMYGNYIITATVMLHASVLQDSLFRTAPEILDYTYFLAASARGKAIYIPDITASYRKNPQGLTSIAADDVNRGLNQIARFFSEQYLKGAIRARHGWKDYTICKSVLRHAACAGENMENLLKQSVRLRLIYHLKFRNGKFLEK